MSTSGKGQAKLVDWEPDSDYETRKCNKTPEEFVKLLKKDYGEALRRLGEC